jgi:hypothetical protein
VRARLAAQEAKRHATQALAVASHSEGPPGAAGTSPH